MHPAHPIPHTLLAPHLIHNLSFPPSPSPHPLAPCHVVLPRASTPATFYLPYCIRSFPTIEAPRPTLSSPRISPLPLKHPPCLSAYITLPRVNHLIPTLIDFQTLLLLLSLSHLTCPFHVTLVFESTSSHSSTLSFTLNFRCLGGSIGGYPLTYKATLWVSSASFACSK